MSERLPDRGSFRTPAAEVSAEVREKGSRFLGFLLPVADEAEARERIRELESRYAGASHHCWAYRLGYPAVERSSDAGEPAGTAGIPIARILSGRGISDALIVVVRWFGGTKLGKGGLARAYAGAAREAVEMSRFVERLPTVLIRFEVPYAHVGAVKRLLRPPDVELESETYAEKVQIALRVAERARREVEGSLADLGIEPSVR